MPNDAKSPLPVDVRRSKTLLLKYSVGGLPYKGSRLGVVFDDFGSTHGGTNILTYTGINYSSFHFNYSCIVISIYMSPCLIYKASTTRQNDSMELAGIRTEQGQRRYCGNLSRRKGGKRRASILQIFLALKYSPKNQKGQTTKIQQFLPS